MNIRNRHEKDITILGMINEKDIWNTINNTILVSSLLTLNKFGLLLVFTIEFDHEFATIISKSTSHGFYRTDVLKNFKKLTKRCFWKSHFLTKLQLSLVGGPRMKL